MIKKNEIQRVAQAFSLPQNSIEKDYILSWLLAGIYNRHALKNQWVFKGGTCIKKCFIETYRFSEDLDFTILDPKQIDTSFLQSEFQAISEWIYEHSGIEVPFHEVKFEKYINPRAQESIEGKVPYKGPLQRRGNNPNVKLNLTFDEILVTPPKPTPILHHYTDSEDFDNLKALSYCLDELFAEKMRAFIERTRPRDLFDIISIFSHDELVLNKGNVQSIFIKKCQHKGIKNIKTELLNTELKKNELFSDWEYMLSHQIANLPPCENYWSKIPSLFGWLTDGLNDDTT